MELLSHLLDADPAAPRLTVYEKASGARMDFSAQTLDNWAAKIANMVEEELELDHDSQVLIDLPVSWQAAVIALGCIAAGVNYDLTDSTTGDQEGKSTADAVFTSLNKSAYYLDGSFLSASTGGVVDVVIVSSDPFGRGVTETGGEIPPGTIDFGPTVRFYGDAYFGTTTPLPEAVSVEPSNQRLLSTGWHDKDSFARAVLSPLAGGGSAVVVSGLVSTTDLDRIAAAERTTATLH
ncbi:MAG: TIGR03089 family protein [Corynebacterium sp.]|nr:TIGR03089 family protein [Corynebacterium sp.]